MFPPLNQFHNHMQGLHFCKQILPPLITVLSESMVQVVQEVRFGLTPQGGSASFFDNPQYRTQVHDKDANRFRIRLTGAHCGIERAKLNEPSLSGAT